MDDKNVHRYESIDPLTNKPILIYRWKYCRAMVYENAEEKWATVSLIETKSEYQNQGHATELMLFLKAYYGQKQYDFGGTVALNPAMSRVYEKTNVKEYKEVE